MKRHYCFFIIASFLLLQSPLYAQFIPAGHAAPIRDIAIDESGNIFSAGEDGFLILWNNFSAIERLQLSHNSLASIRLNPQGTQFSILETDGYGSYKISAWDYGSRVHLFTHNFTDPVTYVNYSALGNYLIVGISARTGMVFLDSQTGEILEKGENLFENLIGNISLAATGRSERNMISYLSSGIISYRDLETGSLLQEINTLSSIRDPLLFGNNRFIAGFDSQGLVVIDAVTGQLLGRDLTIANGIIFLDDSNNNHFFCLVQTDSMKIIYRIGIDNSGRLTRSNQRFLPDLDITSAAAGNGENFFLGTRNGELWISTRITTRKLDTGVQSNIADIAASSHNIAFISGNGDLGFIPLNYNLLRNGDEVILQSFIDSSHNAIISDPQNMGACTFLLYQRGNPNQRENSAAIPMLISLEENSPRRISFSLLDRYNLRFPLRSVSVLGNQMLFLDTSGSFILMDKDGSIIFSFSVTGSMDAAILDESMVILGRISSMGSPTFISINTDSGETVPISLGGMIGVRVERGRTGSIYAAIISQNQRFPETSIYLLNMSNPSMSELLMEYQGEDSTFHIAESGGSVASSIGGEQALFMSSAYPELQYLDRSSGLPIKIVDGDSYFISLDGDSNITWHDNLTGRLLAIFRIHTDSWSMELTENGRIITGGILYN